MGCESWKKETVTEGTQVPLSQTVRGEPHITVRGSRQDEEAYQDEDLYNILVEKRQHRCEAERMRDQMEEARCYAIAFPNTEI